MSFLSTAVITIEAVSQALRSCNIQPSIIPQLIPSSLDFQRLCSSVGVSARSAKGIEKLRKFLRKNAVKIQDDYNRQFPLELPQEVPLLNANHAQEGGHYNSSPGLQNREPNNCSEILRNNVDSSQIDFCQRLSAEAQHAAATNPRISPSVSVKTQEDVAKSFSSEPQHEAASSSVEIRKPSSNSKDIQVHVNQNAVPDPIVEDKFKISACCSTKKYDPDNRAPGTEVVELTINDLDTNPVVDEGYYYGEKKENDDHYSGVDDNDGDTSNGDDRKGNGNANDEYEGVNKNEGGDANEIKETCPPELSLSAVFDTDKIDFLGFVPSRDPGTEIIELDIEDLYSNPEEVKAAKKRRCIWPKGSGSVIGSFTVSPEDWNRVWSWEKDKVLPGRGYSSLIDMYATKNNLTNCHLYSKTPNYNKDNIVIYCYCGYYGCSTFKVVSKTFPRIGESIEFTVEKFGEECHKGRKKKTRHITGLYRQELKKELSTKTAFEYSDECAIGVHSKNALLGNIGKVKPLVTLRKVHSEALAQEDLHKDVMIDAVLRFHESMKNYVPDDIEILDDKETQGEHLYIQRIGLPFFSFIHSIEELQLFITAVADNVSEGRGPSMNLDASSKICKPYESPGMNALLCFYYALVFLIRGKLCTLSSAVLSQHDYHHIAQWLLELRYFMTLHHLWPIKRNLMVIDGSYPLLYSVLEVFNTQTLMDYLNLCYVFVTTEEKARASVFPESITVIKFCCSHKMKNFVDNVSSHKVSKTERPFLLQCIGCLFMCKEYGVLKLLFKHIFCLLLSKFENEKTAEAINFFEQLLGEPDSAYLSSFELDKICNLQTSTEAVEEEKIVSSTAQYAKSPFYKDLKVIYDRVLDSDAEGIVSDPDDPPAVSTTNSNSNNPRPSSDAAEKPSASGEYPPAVPTTQSNSNDPLSSSETSGEPSTSGGIPTAANTTSRVTNKYFCPSFATYLLKKQCPTLPMWTGIVYRPAFPAEKPRWSNAPAEGHMKNTKVDILKNIRNWRHNRFTSRMRYHVRSMWRRNRFSMPATACAQNFPPKPKKAEELSTAKKVKKERALKKTIKKTYNKAKPLSRKNAAVPEEKMDEDETGFEYPSMLVEEQWRRRCGNKKVMRSYIPEKTISFIPSSTEPKTSSAANLQSSQGLTVEKSTHRTDLIAVPSDCIPLPVEPKTCRTLLPLEATSGDSGTLMENGLIDDPKFYCYLSKLHNPEENFNYFIAKYTFHPLGGILSQDFESLRLNKWLNGFALDAIAELFISQQIKYGYIHTLHSTHILDGKISNLTERNFHSAAPFHKEFLTMFYQQRLSHWLLVIAHASSKTFYVLDPMQKYGEKDFQKHKKHMRNFLSFFNRKFPSLSLGSKGWKVSSIDHPLQDDNSNCGIYCLFYLIFILKSHTLPQCIPNSMSCVTGYDGVFVADTLRLLFQKCLLQNSESVKNVCASCGKENDGNVKYCSGKCLRFCHKGSYCLNYFFDVSLTTCRLCSRYSIPILSSFHHPPTSMNTPPQLQVESESDNNISPEMSTSPEPNDRDQPLSDEQSMTIEEYEALLAVKEKFNPEILFSFEDSMQPSLKPEHLREIPEKFVDRYIDVEGSNLPLYVARNPFPALLERNDKLPPCFYSLPNGNVNKLSYYAPVYLSENTLLAYLVCSFCFLDLDCADLYDYDFRTLNYETEVTDNIVDVLSCLLIQLLNHDGKIITYIPCNDTKAFLEREADSCTALTRKVFSEECQYIITVRHNSFHYTVIIIDRLRGTLLHMDPFGGYKEYQYGMELAREFSSLPNVTNRPLKLIQWRHPLQSQNDTVNCGIYCLYFIDHFLRSFVTPERLDWSDGDNRPRDRDERHWSERDFCINSYRDTMKLTLLWHSEDLSQVCVICGIWDLNFQMYRKVNTYHFIRCMDCERIVHQKSKCIHSSDFEDSSTFEPPVFYCMICRTHRDISNSRAPKKAVHEDRAELEKMRRLKFSTNKSNKNSNDDLKYITMGMF